MDINLFIGDLVALQLLFIEAGRSRRHVEDLEHGAALDTFKGDLQATGIVSRDAALLVGRTRERNQGGGVADEMFDLDRVTDGQDVRVGGGQVRVDLDAAGNAELETGVTGQAAIWCDADRKDDQVGVDGFAIGQLDGQATRWIGMERRCSGMEKKAQAFLAHVLVQESSHVRIDRGDDLVGEFDQSDIDIAFHQVLGHLDTDETTADDNGAFRMFRVDKFADLERVRHGAQGVNTGQVNAFHRGAFRLGTRGQDQLVIGLGVGLAGLVVFDRDGLGCAVDLGDFGENAHVHVETLAHGLGRLDQQFVLGLDHVADIIGQAAVGIGNVFTLFKQDDFGLFIVAAQTSCC